LKIFLSSTAEDLVDYRQIADDTTLRLCQESVVMERFGPLPGEPVAECERKARESDVVICVVAHRYGFVPEKGLGSITRREVEAARAAGKNVLVWIVADDHPWTEKKEQDRLTDPNILADPALIADVVEKVAALNDFKTWLRHNFTCESFTTPDDLGRKIALALAHCSKANFQLSSEATARKGEIRIVHALQPAPHFRGRHHLVNELKEWVSDLASPDRVRSLVAAGGTGKTAIVEQVVTGMKPREGSVLVWSFYEEPDADAFLRECNNLFLGEVEGVSGGRLERLQRGLRDGRPHLIVLDGLERVQEEAGSGSVRGELSDHTMKLFLRSLANGLGRSRALLTSRFPLVDLQDWARRGYRETPLDDLSPEAAVEVLRGWEVVGEDALLRAAAKQVGYHALSVAVIGSYLRSFAEGHIEEVAAFDLDAVTGDDPKAAKLARVLAFYADRLPAEERELLARLSVFPLGGSVELLGALVDAGGEVAGLLLQAKPRLMYLLRCLKDRGLVFQYISEGSVTWTAHPFLRERFRQLLGCPAEAVFDVVARDLSAGLEVRPETKPSEAQILDRYERLIEATRLAGREKEAFELYWHAIGAYVHVGWVLGEYQRGYRIVAGFSSTRRPEELAPDLDLRERSLLANEWALYARDLGRLAEAWEIRQLDDKWQKTLNDPTQTCRGLHNSGSVAHDLGLLPTSLRLADAALVEGQDTDDSWKAIWVASRGRAAHALGDVSAAQTDFAAATQLQGEPLYALRGVWQARSLLDLGNSNAARALCENGLIVAAGYNWADDIPAYNAILARVDLHDGNDVTHHINEIRAWTSRTGDMELVLEAHVLTARHLLASGDVQGALSEAETGLLHAESCGYGLLRIELLITLARVWLGWPDPHKAIQTAREALDLSEHPECGYAWGIADAAQVWGEAYLSNHEPTLAQRAFTKALEVRKRIEHPGVAETKRWLDRCG
jgi:tetratricopeptide (TPR) repeat protein